MSNALSQIEISEPEAHGHAPPGSSWNRDLVGWIREGLDDDRDGALSQAGRSVVAAPAVASATLWANLVHEAEILGFLASGGLAFGQGRLADDERTRNIRGEILTEAEIADRGLDRPIPLFQALLQDLGAEPAARSLTLEDDFVSSPPAYVDYGWAPDVRVFP